MYPWLHLGPIVISTYSLMFLCAYIVGGIITYCEAKRQHRATEAILRVALGALAGGMLGAKLSMLIFLGPATFIKDLPYLWYSGQAWTGAFFGGYLGVIVVKRWNSIQYSTGDVFAAGTGLLCHYYCLVQLSTLGLVPRKPPGEDRTRGKGC